MTSIMIDRKAGLSSSTAIKGPCRVATTGNITLAGLQTIDGVVLISGERVLVKDQINATENGLYLSDTGNWTRCKDFSRNDDVVAGTRVSIVDGAAYALTTWQVFSQNIEFGETDIYFGLTYGDVYRVYTDQLGRPLVDQVGRFLVSDARNAPVSPSSPGVKGDVRFDANYLYVCIATNSWKRVGLSTW